LDAQPASTTVTDRPARSPDDSAIELELEAHRHELTGHCRRILGSGFEAEDAVQETMVRAWRRIDGFEGRSTLRSWLYRIATNVCIDMRRGPQRRAQPVDLGPSSMADAALSAARSVPAWGEPAHGGQVVAAGGDPADLVASRETIRLALVATLRHLPPRQRAVLILREVLRWHACEVAELLDSSVASVNSALQRARATLGAVDGSATGANVADAGQQELLSRYLHAFEHDDIGSLVSLVQAHGS
jgi:RNA polymerase sigma-70 factor, ECF subfamily